MIQLKETEAMFGRIYFSIINGDCGHAIDADVTTQRYNDTTLSHIPVTLCENQHNLIPVISVVEFRCA